MLRLAKVYDLEEILIVVGSLSEQSAYLLIEYLELAGVVDPNIFLNFVSFDCRHTQIFETLKKLTRVNSKRFCLHVYSSLNEGIIWTGDDMLGLEAKACALFNYYLIK